MWEAVCAFRGDVTPVRDTNMHDVAKIVHTEIFQIMVEPLISHLHFIAQGTARLVEHGVFGELTPHLLASVGRARLLLAPFFSAGHVAGAIVPALV